MLYQSKLVIDASKKVGIEFIVHLGVYASKNDFKFFWQDLIVIKNQVIFHIQMYIQM